MMLRNDLRIALLIDGDNAQAALIEPILGELDKYGTCVIRRVYGDWTAPNMSSWHGVEQSYGIQLVQQSVYAAGKNTTDIALTIAAMEILHSGKVDTFCIVSSDSDFTPLVIHLKDEGATVIAAGKATTPKGFVNACSLFIVTDTLKQLPKAAAVAHPKSSIKPSTAKPVPAPHPVLQKKPLIKPAALKTPPKPIPSKSTPDPRPLLRKAYQMTPKKDDWVFLGALGHNLRQLDPQFKSQTYGHKGLTQLVSQCGDLFEIRTDKGKGNTSQSYVKLKM
ncbi:MAG: NYN domain-containing protein [Anaerolineae bacterium]|nr:NYN domain-containing protein [Anaerolineae bacterium]